MTGLPTRVAFVSMHTSPSAEPGIGDAGGMNVSLLSLAGELARHGVEVDLLTRAIEEPRERQLETGVMLREVAAGGPGAIEKAGLPAVSDEFGEAIAELARRPNGHYDVIHAHYWLSGVAALPVALEFGIPFVQSFHTLAAMKDDFAEPGAAVEPEFRIRSEAYLASQASAIVAGSAAEATFLLERVRAPADRVWVIPPGVDVDLFRPHRPGVGDRVRSTMAIAEGRPILAVVGRVQPLKDQELAIRALGVLAAGSVPVPVLVIVGEPTPGDEEYLARLRSLAEELGIDEHVRFVGALGRTELAELFAAADLTLMTSRSETFGLVALESAASGTPVVGFQGSGMRESVANGISGVLVDSRDPGVWASTIAGLLADREFRESLSSTARDHALGYTWAASATALLGVYASL